MQLDYHGPRAHNYARSAFYTAHGTYAWRAAQAAGTSWEETEQIKKDCHQYFRDWCLLQNEFAQQMVRDGHEQADGLLDYFVSGGFAATTVQVRAQAEEQYGPDTRDPRPERPSFRNMVFDGRVVSRRGQTIRLEGTVTPLTTNGRRVGRVKQFRLRVRRQPGNDGGNFSGNGSITT